MSNEKCRSWVKIGLTIILTVAGMVYGFGKLNGRFEAVEDEVKKINENENAIIRIQSNVEHIKETTDKHTEILREIEKKL